MYELQPRISSKHHKTARGKPALIEIGASALGKMAAPWAGDLCPAQKFSGTRGALQELPKVQGREERPSSTEEQLIKVLLQDNAAWQEARGDAGRRE